MAGRAGVLLHVAHCDQPATRIAGLCARAAVVLVFELHRQHAVRAQAHAQVAVVLFVSGQRAQRQACSAFATHGLGHTHAFVSASVSDRDL